MLTQKELERYARQISLPNFGIAGQQKLKSAKVLVVGAGGLGCPVLQYLAAAGVGKIGIADGDRVDISNLHRQILFSENDLGKLKATEAAEKLKILNPHLQFEVHPEHLTSRNALEIIHLYDVVVDGSDNFPTRYLVNDACILAEKTLVFGSVFRYEGQVAVFNFPLPDGSGAKSNDGSRSANYRDLFPSPPPPELIPDCATGGVLGVLPGIIGSMLAAETIKILAGIGEPLFNKLMMFDATDFTSRILKIRKNFDTGKITQLIDYEAFCGVGKSFLIQKINFVELQKKQSVGEKFQLIDVREPHEFLEKNIGGRNIPLAQISQNLNFFNKNEDVVLVCRTGRRSDLAAKILIENGFEKVWSMGLS